MRAKGGQEKFEERLRGVERRGLPPEWRAEILGNACGEMESGGVIVRMWRSVPNAVAVPVAACWVAIVVLRATTPGGDVSVAGSGEKEAVNREAAREMFVSWVVGKRDLAGGFDQIEGDGKL